MPPIVEIAQQQTVRLIPTCYYKPPVLQALVDSPEEFAILAELEGRTSERLIKPSLLGEFEGWGRTHIEAAFRYTRHSGNRFNGELRGAWYAAYHEQTAIEEVAFHKTRELIFINVFEEEAVYSALNASFIGRFHDIRTDENFARCLDPEADVGYPIGQELAANLIEKGSRGLIYPSVRHGGGTCIVAFQPNVVQDVRPGARWRITWAGTPNWTATTD